jgi:hypothetical protein
MPLSDIYIYTRVYIHTPARTHTHALSLSLSLSTLFHVHDYRLLRGFMSANISVFARLQASNTERSALHNCLQPNNPTTLSTSCRSAKLQRLRSVLCALLYDCDRNLNFKFNFHSICIFPHYVLKRFIQFLQYTAITHPNSIFFSFWFDGDN